MMDYEIKKDFYKRKQKYFYHQNLMYGNFQSRIYTRDY